MAKTFPEIPAKDTVSSSGEHTVASSEVCRDDEFYFDFVTFKAENCLFRVPRHEFERQSTVFRDMFTLPVGEEKGKAEGRSDDSPILLDSVSKESFKLLLKMLYPPESKDISSSLTLEQCMSLLKVTHMWDFERIDGIVKKRLRNDLWSEIFCADAIKLAHDYEIKEWYADAYYDLAIRVAPLDVEEGYKLGMEFTIKMGQVREKVAAALKARREITAKRAVEEIFFETQNVKRSISESEEWIGCEGKPIFINN